MQMSQSHPPISCFIDKTIALQIAPVPGKRAYLKVACDLDGSCDLWCIVFKESDLLIEVACGASGSKIDFPIDEGVHYVTHWENNGKEMKQLPVTETNN